MQSIKDQMPKNFQPSRAAEYLKTMMPKDFKAPSFGSKPAGNQAGGASGEAGGASDRGSMSRGRVCGIVCIVLGVVLLIVGIMGTMVNGIELYKKVSCKPAGFAVKNLSLSNFKMDLAFEVECQNPNPYGIDILPGGNGKLLLEPKDDGQQLTTFTIERFILQPEGAGSARVSVALDLANFKHLLRMDEVAFYIAQKLDATFKVDVVGQTKTVDKSLDAKCKFALEMPSLTQMLTGKKPKLGKASCGQSWEDLKDGKDLVDDLGDKLDKAEENKEMIAGAVMGCGYGFGIVLICIGIFLIWRSRNDGADSNDVENPTVENAASPSIIGRATDQAGKAKDRVLGLFKGPNNAGKE